MEKKEELWTVFLPLWEHEFRVLSKMMSIANLPRFAKKRLIDEYEFDRVALIDFGSGNRNYYVQPGIQFSAQDYRLYDFRDELIPKAKRSKTAKAVLDRVCDTIMKLERDGLLTQTGEVI